MSRKILSDLELASGARLRGLLAPTNDDEPTRWIDSFMRSRLAKTGAYTVVAADRGQYIDVTSGTWSLTLTAAATLGAGFAFAVFNSGSGVVTVDANASETIRDAVSSATTKTLAQGEGAFLNCDGTGWGMMKIGAGSVPSLQSVLAVGAAANNTTITGVKAILFNGEIDDGNSSTADTIDWTTGAAHKSTLTGPCVYTFTAPGGITAVTLKLVQDATGGRVPTFPSAVKNAPTLTTTANTTSIINFYYDSTNYWAALLCTGVA